MTTHEPTSCGQPCETCPGASTCAEHATRQDATPIDRAEAEQRFTREASEGELDTGRYRMRYFTWGAGPPLVFIHGVTETARAFVLPCARLSAQFRCIAYDLPNGRDDGARLSAYRHVDLVADLWALLDHLRLDQAYLFGSSFGSTIALAALAERPERLPRGILQGGLARRPLRMLEWLAAQAVARSSRTVNELPGRLRLARRLHEPTFRDRPAGEWEAFLARTGATPAAALARQLLLLHRLDLRPLLPRIRQPILLVIGDRDPIVGQEHANMLLRGLPSAGLAILDSCGHVPMYTHPEMLAAVVRQFLTPPAPVETPCVAR